ncbi:hypothetical protein Acor_23020 [Acrocarpospora corrugata]|uniref:TIGR03086 family protein n=1 Tax=Acrocarpospora corrugata TaxID=35763 RepID=A0A5M3VVM6_9ACTN|nr:TIGR03086 family metal-binding protein [Acrocarpospora corrugata]GES00239.1 hypothetical protein Acor_23020 [Acrocarpospora corrugata]
MDPLIIVKPYYQAWQQRAGDMSGVALADGFTFHGPVADFQDAEGYRAMAREAGAAVLGFRVRHQFAAGDLVCSIIDWEMAGMPGTLTSAELLRVRDGEIVSGELIYDAEDLRRAMAPTSAAQPGIGGLLERSHGLVGRILGQITPQGWAAASPCRKWTVRQSANHLTGALLILARVAEGRQVEAAEFDAQHQADTDHLGADPAAAFAAVAARSVAAFAAPGALEADHAFMGTRTPGAVLASISLLESLVHGWDIATGAGLDYPADAEVVLAAWQHAATGVGDHQREAGQFAAVLPVLPTADPLTRLLAHLGRSS